MVNFGGVEMSVFVRPAGFCRDLNLICVRIALSPLSRCCFCMKHGRGGLFLTIAPMMYRIALLNKKSSLENECQFLLLTIKRWSYGGLLCQVERTLCSF